MVGFLVSFGLFLAVSCDDDDNGGMMGEEMPTCTDGIMNGDETGIDCGGSCTRSMCIVGGHVYNRCVLRGSMYTIGAY